MTTLPQYLLVQQVQSIGKTNLLKRGKRPGDNRIHGCQTLAEGRNYRETFSAPILKPLIFLMI